MTFMSLLTSLANAQNRAFPYSPSHLIDESRVQFDITSIRESAPAPQYSERLVNDSHSGQFLATNLRVSQLIAEAFGVNFQFQVANVPKEIQDRRFNVNAKSDESTDLLLHDSSDDQALRIKQKMLQAMLKDRFHLQSHVELRPLPSYVLQISPSGTKLRQLHQKDGDDAGFRTKRTAQGIEVEGRNVAIDALPTVLSFYLKSTVVNQTALAGTYDLDLKFSNSMPGTETPSEDLWPPLQIALQEQLGLKLLQAKVPTPVVVVGHMEMPTPN